MLFHMNNSVCNFWYRSFEKLHYNSPEIFFLLTMQSILHFRFWFEIFAYLSNTVAVSGNGIRGVSQLWYNWDSLSPVWPATSTPYLSPPLYKWIYWMNKQHTERLHLKTFALDNYNWVPSTWSNFIFHFHHPPTPLLSENSSIYMRNIHAFGKSSGRCSWRKSLQLLISPKGGPFSDFNQ